MKRSSLSDKIESKRSDFLCFLENTDQFTEAEKDVIREKFEDPSLAETVKVFFVLLAWSGAALAVNGMFVLGSAYLFLRDEKDSALQLYEMFILLNTLAKLGYIHTKTSLPLAYNVVAQVPYAGGTILLLLKMWGKENALLRQSFLAYQSPALLHFLEAVHRMKELVCRHCK